MGVPILTVDAFTDRPFRGNPAAVCPLDGPPDEQWLRDVAAEMNLSETAFLWPEADGFHLRWLTPTVEVDLCGHATLASAHVLWERKAAGDVIRFHTRSGLLTAVRRDDWIELDFPATPPEAMAIVPEAVEVLGVEPTYVGRTVHDLFLAVSSDREVRGLRPDFRELSALSIRGLIVTGPSRDPAYHFVSRFFTGSGIDEDPVTGSAHCALGPYWGAQLNRVEMVGYQASARGGVVRVGLAGDRVKLRGQAVTVCRGEIVV